MPRPIDLPRDADEKRLWGRAKDYLEVYESGGESRFLPFLDMRQQRLVRAATQGSVTFYGGYAGAERVMAAFGAYAQPEDFPLRALQVCLAGEGTLSHRDVLGALMAQGIERHAIGDILVDGLRVIIFAQATLYDYLRQNLQSIGRLSVKSMKEADAITLPPQKTEPLTFTVASARMDAIIAALCNLSRGDAAEVLRRELATLNAVVVEGDCPVEAGDRIAVRGHGRFDVLSIGEPGRKGRHRVEALRYL